MGSARGGQQGDFAADAAASADDQGDAAAEFLLGRLAAQFGLFQRPVLDAEGLKGGQRDVVGEDLEAGGVHAFADLRKRAFDFALAKQAGAFHHVNGVGVELAGDAGLGLVLAEAEHAQAGDEHDGGAGVAQCGRVGRGELVIVGAVLLAVFGERVCRSALEGVETGVGCPGHEERTNLGADEVVGATGAEERQLLGVARS